MIRALVVGVPLALLALLLAALLNTTTLRTRQENEMSIGTLAEASNLNPILSTDAASSQVSGLIFQALLTVDENMQPKGELAESWSLHQTSTLFFADGKTAESAREALQAVRASWPESLQSLAVGEVGGLGELRLELDLPGLDATREVVGLLKAKGLEPSPIASLTLQVPGEGTELLGRLQSSGLFPEAVRWFSEGGSHLEISLALTQAEEATLFESRLREWLAREKPDLGEKYALVLAMEEPFLAEPEVVFQLRRGVTWQDGEPFTSQDVLFTYQSIMDDRLASPRKPDFTLVREILTPTPWEVRVRYRRPYAPALNSWRMSILPAHILSGKSREWWAENFNRRPVGTGPFQLGEWKTNEFIRLVRNPHYWQAPGPWLDAVVFRVLPDPLTLRLAFETRQVDFWTVDPWAVNAFRQDQRLQIFTSPSSSYSYVGWNLRRPIFQDRAVRRALAQGVNVPAMIQYLLYSYGVQSTGIFTPQMWFFDPAIQPIAYDPAAARAALAEAGWKPGPDGILQKDGERFSFTVITNNASEVRRDIATLLQADLLKIGIEVKIELYEWAVFIARYINKGDFDAMVLGWQLPQDDFDQFQIWHSSQTNPEQLNVVGYQNPRVDRLLETIRQEFNRGEVMRLAAELQRTIYEDQPYLFLFVPESTTVMWRDAYRVCRPDGQGGWIEEPVRLTPAGWGIYLEWFFRPEHPERLPQDRVRAMEESRPENLQEVEA